MTSQVLGHSRGGGKRRVTLAGVSGAPVLVRDDGATAVSFGLGVVSLLGGLDCLPRFP